MAHVYVNKTTGGVNMGYVGRHLQLLWFYVENNKVNADSSTCRNEIEKRRQEKTSQQPGILRAVTHPGSNLSLTSARSTSTWLMSTSCNDTQANINAVCHRHNQRGVKITEMRQTNLWF